MEIIDNWELVIKGSDLVNNFTRLEDSENNCALVREIGTDSPDTISFGVEDIIYTRINKLIAPYYKGAYNLNRMQFSQVRDGKWFTTGFELPIPLDRDIYISGLASNKKVYLKGTLFKGILRGDDPVNRYLRARMVEVPYKKLHPLYYENVQVPTTFQDNKKFILRTDDVANPTFEEWDATNPHYTIVPEKNTKYVLNNPIEVLWTHDEIPVEDVEFRVWYDGVEDLKVKPRLDHMFLPPSDGKSRWVQESILIKAAQPKAYDVGAGGVPAAGSNVDITLATASEAAKFPQGTKALISDGTNYEIVTVLDNDTTGGTVTVDKITKDYTDTNDGDTKLYTPVTQLKYQPLAEVDVEAPVAGIVAVDNATGLVFATAGDDNDPFVFKYYAFVIGGGKDIFTMRALNEKYRVLEDPHKITFMFVNKSGVDPTKTGTLTLYTLSQFYRSTPPEVASAVERTLSEVQAAGITI